MKEGVSSMTAGKISPEAMQASFSALNLPAEDFPRPGGLTEQQVCGDTALRPGEPQCRQDLFVAGPAPAPPTVATTPATSPPTAPPQPTHAFAPPTPPPPTPQPPTHP